ncbi:MAG: hypothetical protein RIB58_05315 [Phycisphaerales bacterium]
MTRVLPTWVCLFVTLGWVLAGCERSPTAPSGGGVRIATTSPAVGIMLRDFGAAELAVGRSGYDIALDPTLPVVGDAAGIDLERLSALRATHAFVETGASAPPAGLVEVADASGFELVTFELTSLEQLIEVAQAVHAVVRGQVDAGPAPADRFAAALEPDSALADAGAVLLLIPGTPAAALGPGSVHHEVLVAMGGRSALEGGRPYMPVDAEDVLAISPDAIVVLAPGEGEDWASLLGSYSALPVPAIERGRVAVLRDADVLMASTSTLRFADDLRGVLLGWAEDE